MVIMKQGVVAFLSVIGFFWQGGSMGVFFSRLFERIRRVRNEE